MTKEIISTKVEWVGGAGVTQAEDQASNLPCGQSAECASAREGEGVTSNGPLWRNLTLAARWRGKIRTTRPPRSWNDHREAGGLTWPSAISGTVSGRRGSLMMGRL